MSESAAARPLRDMVRTGDSVVRPLRRGGQRLCARPGCAAEGTATLTFQYETRSVSIVALSDDPLPEAYDLCSAHADRTKPPHGWSLEDDRAHHAPAEVQGPPSDLGSERTVAVLAAALRRDQGADADLLGMPDDALPDEDPDVAVSDEESDTALSDDLPEVATADEPEVSSAPQQESFAPGWQVPAAGG